MENNEPHKKLGSGMITAAWIILLGLLTVYFGNFLEHQQNPNMEVMTRSERGITEVTLRQNRQGHYVATGKINGSRVDFMLDTGATMVSIPEHIAKSLHLNRGPAIEVTTANGTIPVYATVLDEVTLGNISLANVRATINPYMGDDFILLGMTFLKQLEFTQQNDELILRQYR